MEWSYININRDAIVTLKREYYDVCYARCDVPKRELLKLKKKDKKRDARNVCTYTQL